MPLKHFYERSCIRRRSREIKVRDKVLLKAENALRFRNDNVNQKHDLVMGTRFVKKCLVSVTVCQKVNPVCALVPSGRGTEKSYKIPQIRFYREPHKSSSYPQTNSLRSILISSTHLDPPPLIGFHA
jgi:hypothetical protein